jgi:DNA-binding SARP family transcriptional activator
MAKIASMPPGGEVTRVQFRILGPMEVGFGDRGVPIDAARQRTVLATLLLEPNRVLPAERIIALVWGDDPPATAHKTLQTLVHRLRRRLETLGGDEPLLLTQPPGYLLRLSPSDLDLHRLQQLHQAGAQAMNGGDPQAAAQLLRRAELMSRPTARWPGRSRDYGNSSSRWWRIVLRPSSRLAGTWRSSRSWAS